VTIFFSVYTLPSFSQRCFLPPHADAPTSERTTGNPPPGRLNGSNTLYAHDTRAHCPKSPRPRRLTSRCGPLLLVRGWSDFRLQRPPPRFFQVRWVEKPRTALPTPSRVGLGALSRERPRPPKGFFFVGRPLRPWRPVREGIRNPQPLFLPVPTCKPGKCHKIYGRRPFRCPRTRRARCDGPRSTGDPPIL